MTATLEERDMKDFLCAFSVVVLYAGQAVNDNKSCLGFIFGGRWRRRGRRLRSQRKINENVSIFLVEVELLPQSTFLFLLLLLLYAGILS